MEGENTSKKLVFVIAPPATGHLNPLCSLIYELNKNWSEKLEIVFYNDECYRTLIEKSGARFRLFSHLTFSQILHRPITERKLTVGEMLNYFITFAFDVLPQLIADTERDQPDLILYDTFFYPTKCLIEIIKTRQANGTWTRKVPKTIGFVPNFPHGPQMIKQMRLESNEDFWSFYELANAFRRQFLLSWNFGISAYNPLGIFSKYDETINLVSVAPELEPYPEDFDERFKFLGPCVSEEARSVEIKDDDELRLLLDQFVLSSDNRKASTSDLKLIYMSLGTVFNGNDFIFEKVFDAVRNFDKGNFENLYIYITFKKAFKFEI